MQFSDENEAELISRAQQQGDVAAFAQLVRLHQSRLRSFLVRLVKNYDLADDLAQEVFIIAFRKVKSYSGKGRFAAWLFRIGLNCFCKSDDSSNASRK